MVITNRKKTWTIYVRTLNGKCYVGQTSGFESPENQIRLRAGKNGSGYRSTKDAKFYNAIKKTGWMFVVSDILVFGITNQEDANDLETFFIKYFNSFRGGYNMNNGQGDYEHGSQLYYGNKGLFENKDFHLNNTYKNSSDTNRSFVESIVSRNISGKPAIRKEMLKWGIVESSLSHYLYRSSDPSGNRFNEEFYDLWTGAEKETPVCNLFD